MTENSGYSGSMQPGNMAGEFNQISFIVSQILGRISTSTLVKIVKCTNSGGVSPVGFVDVQPLVNQVDGQGNPVPHGTIYGLPYFRVQGGQNAVIIDPEVGDIGIAVFASRDISKVKATKAQALPGSGRSYDMADGMYIGGLINGTPAQYVQFNASGITITSPSKVTVNAPDVEINAETVAVNASSSADITSPTTTINGDLVVTGLITGDGGLTVTGNVAVTGKVNATNTIESAANLKVAGVTLNVP